ncbi:MAG: extracellular solute-binding protein [Caldilineaceae bacterium]|nr:extracellular solute-binding protein [Caldilineaceae bacterium]
MLLLIMNWCKQLVTLALLLLLLTACSSSNQQPSSALQGRILLWHTWTGREAAVLADVLTRFRAIQPGITVKQQVFTSTDEMLRQFAISADAGLGPDLMLAPSQWIRPLHDAQLIDEVGSVLEETTLARYLPTSLTAVTYQDGLYGIPLALDTMVLYYDRTLVEKPAATLNELLAVATSGQLVEMSTTFSDAFWGIQAFGGQLFDTEQRVILDRGGFTNWLAWLKDARTVPAMIMETNRTSLLRRFQAGNIAYYVGSTSEYGSILASRGYTATAAVTGSIAVTDAAAIGPIGVALLPTGPTGSAAAPLLQVQAFLFSHVSSDKQRAMALALAQFASNAEQQTSLMRGAGVIPANQRVRVNARLEPVSAVFVAQARNGIALPPGPEIDPILRFGDDAYAQVLEGLIDPATAAVQTTAAINQANGFAATTTTRFQCQQSGTLYMGVVADSPIYAFLEEVIAQLQRECPTMLVNLVPVTLNDVQDRLQAPLVADGRIDMVVAPQSWLLTLAPENLLMDLTVSVDVATLQRYRPIAVAALRYQDKLYGLPLAMQVDALYFNRALVSEPAPTLNDLRSQALAGVPIWLDTTFIHTYWGITAFGGQLFDSNYQAQLDQGGFADWLAWLKEARDNTNVQLLADRAAVEQQFLSGRSAYLVADGTFLTTARASLGAEQVGVALLPAGPGGDGQPLLSATGFFYSERLSAQQLALALDFTSYVTNVANQGTLFTTTGLLPTNAGVEGSNEPLVAVLMEQSERAQVTPNVPQMRTVLAVAGRAYYAVFDGNVAPADAAAAVTQQINNAGQIEED